MDGSRLVIFTSLYLSIPPQMVTLPALRSTLLYFFFLFVYNITRSCTVRLYYTIVYRVNGGGGFLLSVNAIITRDKRFLNEFYLQFSHFFSTKSFNYVVLYTRIVKHLYNVLNRYKCKHSLV